MGANFFDARAVILAEIGDGFVIGREPSRQPHHFQVAASFALQPTAALNPVEIAVNVKFEQHAGVIARPAGRQRLGAVKAKLA